MPSAAVGLADKDVEVRTAAKIKLGLEKKIKNIDYRNRVRKIFKEGLKKEFSSFGSLQKGHFCQFDFTTSPNKNYKINRVEINMNTEEEEDSSRDRDKLYFNIKVFKVNERYSGYSFRANRTWRTFEELTELKDNLGLDFLTVHPPKYGWGSVELSFKKTNYEKINQLLPKLIDWIKNLK